MLKHVAAYADWNDKNIVLKDGHWEQVQVEPLPGQPAPPPPRDDRWKYNETSIVVLIASFRETRCPETLHSMITKAAHPERVFAGIVQQNSAIDEDCLAGYCKRMGAELTKDAATGTYLNQKGCPFYEQFRFKRLSDLEAKGPVYARALQAELVKEDDDDFCMQIDAHTLFIEAWDVRILNEWGAAKNEYAVLSTYPTNVHDLHKNSNNHWEMPHLCHASFAGPGKVANGRASAAANLERPLLAPLWAAGLSFSRCHAERNVPNDINLKSVFAGEEYGRGARLWTHGYDFYSISRPIIGTYYGGEKGGGGSGRFDAKEIDASTKRLSTLLKWPNSDQSDDAWKELGSYGLGKRRTLEQYAEWSGVNTITTQIRQNCIVSYVPWIDKSSEYAEYEPIGNEIVKDSMWKRRGEDKKLAKIQTGMATSGEASKASSSKYTDKALLVNLIIFVTLFGGGLCCLMGHVIRHFRRVVKPSISKYTL